jgi:hypothetical protein
MSVDDYRDYFEEEEKPEPRPAGRWFGGLILGLIIGGIIGFALGGGSLGSFFDDMQSNFGGGSMWIVLTITIIGVTMLKNAFVRRNDGGNVQAARWLVMMFLIIMALTCGMFSFFLAGR